MSQKFCNILVTWGTIWQLQLLRLWRGQIALDFEILCLPDTLQVQLTVFVSMVWSMTSESTLLGLPDLAWLLRFLQAEQNFLNHLVTEQLINWLFPWSYCPLWIHKALVSNLEDVHLYSFQNTYTQCVSAPTTTILPTPVSAFHSLCCILSCVIINNEEHVYI